MLSLATRASVPKEKLVNAMRQDLFTFCTCRVCFGLVQLCHSPLEENALEIVWLKNDEDRWERP
jgi:hypothetical protein